jgi:hypothetical protein
MAAEQKRCHFILAYSEMGSAGSDSPAGEAVRNAVCVPEPAPSIRGSEAQEIAARWECREVSWSVHLRSAATEDGRQPSGALALWWAENYSGLGRVLQCPDTYKSGRELAISLANFQSTA